MYRVLPPHSFKKFSSQLHQTSSQSFLKPLSVRSQYHSQTPTASDPRLRRTPTTTAALSLLALASGAATTTYCLYRTISTDSSSSSPAPKPSVPLLIIPRMPSNKSQSNGSNGILSPEQVDAILKRNEATIVKEDNAEGGKKKVDEGVYFGRWWGGSGNYHEGWWSQREEARAIVDKMDCNSVGSNDPCEDFTMHHKFGNTLLIGVFDGHGGTECGKTISQYLGHYLAHSLSILPAPPHPDAPASDHRTRRDKVTQAIRSAFTRLDDDLLKGGLDLYPSAPHNKPAPPALPWSSPHPRITEPEFAERMRAAVAGSCAIVAYVEGRELYVACTGDSRGVVGMRRADGTMEAVEMSRDQTVRNPGEYARMVEEHPGEGETVFVRGRVLGGLMPTRAFGDARYKWPRGVQSAVLPLIGKRGMPRNFYTPPYVTAAPEIVHRTLSPGRDKFLILATDGLWDVLESDDAVDAVARLPGGANAATELVRCALGDGDSGDVVKMGRVLGIPPPQSRRYRDDVTVRVLWFEGEDGGKGGKGTLGVEGVEFGRAEVKPDWLSSWMKNVRARL